MSQELKERLKKLDEEIEEPLIIPKKIVESPVKTMTIGTIKKSDVNVIDLRELEESFNDGMILQVYKKKGKMVIGFTPLFSKWSWLSLGFDALLIALLATKIVGFW